MDARSSVAHPDPIEAGARAHERVGMTIMMDCVSDYINDQANGRQSEALATSLFDAWIRMDCPGLVDGVVVNCLREHNLISLWMDSIKGHHNTEIQEAEQDGAQNP
jgi:hypothetical protein